MNKIAKLSALVFAAMAFAAGCSTVKSSPIVPNAPDWVNKGTGAFKDASGAQVFYGVGVLQGVRNQGLARPAADDLGRAEIARIMSSYVTSLTKSYMASTTAGAMDKSSEEQMVSQTMKNFAKFTLIGAIPVDHYVDRSIPNSQVMYSLVKLDMAAVKKSLEESKELDAKVRDYVKANAEKAFDDLSAEEAKH